MVPKKVLNAGKQDARFGSIVPVKNNEDEVLSRLAKRVRRLNLKDFEYV